MKPDEARSAAYLRPQHHPQPVEHRKRRRCVYCGHWTQRQSKVCAYCSHLPRLDPYFAQPADQWAEAR